MKYYVDGCSFACDWEDHISWSHHLKNKTINAYSGKSNISIFHDTYQAMQLNKHDCYLVMFTYSDRQEVETDKGTRHLAFGSHVINKDGSYNNNYLFETRRNTERYIKCLSDYSDKHNLNFKFITVEPAYCFDSLPEEKWFNSNVMLDREEHSWLLHSLITIYGAQNKDLRNNFSHLGNDANFQLYKDIINWLGTGNKPNLDYCRENIIMYLRNNMDSYQVKQESSKFLGGVVKNILQTGFLYES